MKQGFSKQPVLACYSVQQAIVALLSSTCGVFVVWGLFLQEAPCLIVSQASLLALFFPCWPLPILLSGFYLPVLQMVA